MTGAYIIDAVRTPRARKNKEFAGVHPVDLLTYPLEALASRNNIPTDKIDDVITGCVTQVKEQSWCMARSAVLACGWPESIPATTVNRLCGSGQQACNFVAQGIMAGTYELAIGSGVEHMTRAPMFSDVDGETSPKLLKHYPDLVQQGLAAEILSETYSLSREELDQYSAESQQRAAKAQQENRFKNALVSVPFTTETGAASELSIDATVRPGTTTEVLAGLKTVFKEDGVITAGNASAIVDGAGAVLYASEKACKDYDLKPRAKIRSMVAVGSAPKIMLTGPISASKKALEKAQVSVEDINVWEINEAFAPVPLVVIKELGLNHEKVNINGGGISLGHPLGATGTMLIGTAIDELERQDKELALVTMCIGLGMGIATVVERL